MNNPHRFSRLRIQEDDFPLQLPEEIKDTFLEVVDAEGDMLGLFCLLAGLENRVFTTLDALAHDYDALFYQHRDDDDWQPAVNITGCAIPFPKGNLKNDQYHTIYKDLDLRTLVRGMSAYGRLRFPYRLEDAPVQKMWCGFLNTDFLAVLLQYALSDSYEKYRDDLVEIFQFLFDLWGVRGTNSQFRSLFNNPYPDHQSDKEQPFVLDIDAFAKLDLTIIEPMASFLFTKDNIDLFIQAAARINKQNLVAYLQEYQRLYLDYYLGGYPRLRILDSEFPEKLPPAGYDDHMIVDQSGKLVHEKISYLFWRGYIPGFFIEIINIAGVTVGLFHIFHTMQIGLFPDKLAFTRYYDENSANYHGFSDASQDSGYYYFLITSFTNYTNVEGEKIGAYEEYLKMMRNHTVSSELEFCKLMRLEDVGGDLYREFEPENELIVYGRLKYPYLLDEAAKSVYEESIPACIYNLFNSIEELEAGTNTSELFDKIDMLKFFLNYNQQEKNSYGKDVENVLLVLLKNHWACQVFVDVVEQILDDQIEAAMIEPLMEAAHKTQNVEVLAYLLEYQHKHFPPQGTSSLKF